MPLNLPNVLTLLRILAIPLLVGLYFLPPLVIAAGDRDWLAAMLFSVAAITDWFDGWLARRWGQTSAFGSFLDPVADKLIVCAALLVLLQLGRVDGFIALIIIGREITISALREWMATIGARGNVAVHSVGKFKTAAQMIAIVLLLFDSQVMGVDVRPAGTILVNLAAALTLWSMAYYLRKAWPYLREDKGGDAA
jgi:CDP-diacylglycerol--glycerol-3-phosphate 3-phosphatidyltransferase/cardiolipin synthase